MANPNIGKTDKKEQAIVNEFAKQHVWEDIAHGVKHSKMYEKLMTDEYNIGKTYSKAQAIDIVNETKKQIKKYWEEEREHLKEVTQERLDTVYEEAMARNDRQSAIGALKEFSKLTGLYDAQKVDVNLKGDIEIEFGL